MSNEAELGRTLVLIKPDAIERGLTGEIIKRFERKGFRIVKAEMRLIDEDLAKTHYLEHKDNTSYYNKMIEAITHGPVVAMILEGFSAVESSRQLIGSASPSHSQVGTIRGDLAYEEAFNLVHGSDSNSAAYREISLWFSPEDYFPEGTDPKIKKKWEVKVGGSPKEKHPWYDETGFNGDNCDKDQNEDYPYDDHIIPIVLPENLFSKMDFSFTPQLKELISND